jgi:hypothetical protein
MTPRGAFIDVHAYPVEGAPLEPPPSARTTHVPSVQNDVAGNEIWKNS